MSEKRTLNQAIDYAYSHQQKFDELLDTEGLVNSKKVSYANTDTEFLASCKTVFEALNKLDGNLRQILIVDDLTKVSAPSLKVLYYSISDNKMYRYTGSEFINITSDIKLGENEGEAYPGVNGKKLENRLNSGDVTVVVGTSSTSLQKAIDTGLFKGEQGERGPQGEQGPQGVQGEKGEKGEQGPAWKISKTFTSAAQMASSSALSVGEYCIIDTGNKNDDDYGNVYMRSAVGVGSDKWTFIIDMSVSGLKGDKGDKGDKGEQGEQGIPGSVIFNKTSDSFIKYVLEENTDTTFTTAITTNPIVEIPSTLNHGLAGLNFMTDSNDRKLQFSNFTGLPLLLIVNGAPSDLTISSGYLAWDIPKNKYIRTVFWIWGDIVEIEIRTIEKP